MKVSFDHEKLKVYQKAIEFITWLTPVLSNCEGTSNIKNQIDRASTSIALNIAEGNGKFSLKDRNRFIDIANGSALECAAGLDVLVAQNKLITKEILEGKNILFNIVSMLYGLRKANTNRICDDEGNYSANADEAFNDTSG